MSQGSVAPPHFLERDSFDLADSFARDAKCLAGFFERIIRLSRMPKRMRMIFSSAADTPADRLARLFRGGFDATLLRTFKKIRHERQKFLGSLDVHPMTRFGNAHNLCVRKDLHNL
jgi:hypothetical protein